jgi:hypothetical protein
MDTKSPSVEAGKLAPQLMGQPFNLGVFCAQWTLSSLGVIEAGRREMYLFL